MNPLKAILGVLASLYVIMQIVTIPAMFRAEGLDLSNEGDPFTTVGWVIKIAIIVLGAMFARWCFKSPVSRDELADL
jgi:hypothetical protein